MIVSSAVIGFLTYRQIESRSLAERFFGELVDLVPAAILIRREDDNRIVEISDEFAEETGIPREKLVEATIGDLDIPLAELQDPQLAEKLHQEGELDDYEQVFGDADAPRVALVSSRLVEEKSERYVFSVAQDITPIHKAKRQLEHAYDQTIMGWAQALEFRDEETFEHTLRVTKATVALAEELGVDEEELPHIRRGALLHDIGKVGIPDGILLKAGKLTDEEWSVMEQHPVYARDLLSDIDYLSPALDIPYCHHEKWDGSGYPRGLAGEDIPLAARIFAIIDVWDALLSERPYRDPWTRQRVLDLLEDEKGTHFQPDLVDVFIALESRRTDELRNVSPKELLEHPPDSPSSSASV